MSHPIYVVYDTDFGTKLNIMIQYQKNQEERLAIGKLEELSSACRWRLIQKDIRPRYVVHVDLGQIYFKTHEDYLEYVKNNKEKIKKMEGERLNCRGIVFAVST